MNSPKVSVCIPTFNGIKHIRNCIKGVVAQTFQDFEVVICDDSSTDGTLAFAKEIAAGDERFRFIQNPARLGLVANWNNCIQHSRGEWIKFAFDDDVLAPTCIEKLLNACETQETLFSFCARNFIFEPGVSQEMRDVFLAHKERIQSDYSLLSTTDPKYVARIAANEPNRNLVGEPIVTLINRSIFEELGLFDEALIQLCDSEFWYRIMISQRTAFVAESLAEFRVHSGATTAHNLKKRSYRMFVLDPLVLRYKFAFDQRFHAVRNPNISGKSKFSHFIGCSTSAADAFAQAKLMSDRQAGCNDKTMAEWVAVKNICPGLTWLVYIGSTMHFFRRLRTAIARKLVWIT